MWLETTDYNRNLAVFDWQYCVVLFVLLYKHHTEVEFPAIQLQCWLFGWAFVTQHFFGKTGVKEVEPLIFESMKSHEKKPSLLITTIAIINITFSRIIPISTITK